MDTIETMREGPTMEIHEQRQKITSALKGIGGSIIGIEGPCALTSDFGNTEKENSMAEDVSSQLGITILRRLPPWKPRTNPEDWHGEETTKPDETLQMLAQTAKKYRNLCIEIGKEEHIDKYIDLLTFAWVGSRNSNNIDLMEKIALSAPDLPLGVKNGLDGNIGDTLETIKHLVMIRGEGAAPIVMIYRGGTNAKTPNDWEDKVTDAVHLTKGRVIVDVAHGGEMAHDPGMKFNKTVVGQMACLDHLIELVKRGVVPVGVMIEASNIESPTDPTIPVSIALDKIIEINRVASH